MLFRKRKAHSTVKMFSDMTGPGADSEKLMRLDYKMMLRGNIIERPEGKVRQIGVTVDGSTKVVTSGDLINLETYKALLQVGAIQPKASEAAPEEKPAD